jgi:hypothetical protein
MGEEVQVKLSSWRGIARRPFWEVVFDGQWTRILSERGWFTTMIQTLTSTKCSFWMVILW